MISSFTEICVDELIHKHSFVEYWQIYLPYCAGLVKNTKYKFHSLTWLQNLALCWLSKCSVVGCIIIS